MMTDIEYEQYLYIEEQKKSIIAEMLTWEPTHQTTRVTWYGYERPANTLLIASPELGELFHLSEVRDACGCVASWYVTTSGEIMELWACEVEEVN